MMHRIHRSDKAHRRNCTSDDEDGFKCIRRNVADKRYRRVDLPGVSRSAERQPSDQQDGEGGEPRDGGDDGEIVQLVVGVEVAAAAGHGGGCVRRTGGRKGLKASWEEAEVVGRPWLCTARQGDDVGEVVAMARCG